MEKTSLQPIIKMTCSLDSQASEEIEYEVLGSTSPSVDSQTSQIQEQKRQIEQQIQTLTIDSKHLINNADNFDYTIAVASGIIAGIIDSFFVGEFSLDRGTKWGDEKVKRFVSKIAQKKGYDGDGGILGAVRYLENEYKIPADTVTNNFGGGLYHHLRDFSHHPTPIGLIFSILTQFTQKVYGTNTAGAFVIVPLSKDGLLLIGNTWQSKLFLGVVHWFFHMVSDMAGSSSSLVYGKYGTGLPGLLVSLLKELSSLKIFNNSNETNKFSLFVSKLFNGTLLSERDANGKIIPENLIKFDLRAEIGVLHELGRQAIPVIVNECIVRSSYFIRQLYLQIHKNDISSVQELIHKVDWHQVLPFNNRTIARMLTISTGCFFAIDITDAAVRSAIKNGGNVYNPKLYTDFVLRINYVNVGRFVIAISSDIKKGIQREQVSAQIIEKYNELIHINSLEILDNQRVLLHQVEMVEESFQEIAKILNSYNEIIERDCHTKRNINEIGMRKEQAIYNNPELAGIFSNL